MVGSGAVGTSWQGLSASLSADGNTAIVGGWADNGFVGAAWVWTRNSGVWTQQGPKLVGSGVVGQAHQGSSVSLSADGNTAVIGGPNDNNSTGAVWAWTRSGGVWTQQGSKLVGSGSQGLFGAQGSAVSISAGGNTLVSGSPHAQGGAGAVWVWARSGGTWNQLGAELVGTGAVGQAGLGSSVGVSADGATVFVGGPFDNGRAGAAWVFTRVGGN